MIQKLKILVTDPVLDVALAASEEVVNDGDFMSLDHQLVNQMRANEPSSARHLHSTQYFRQPQSSAVSQRYSIHNMRLETRYSYKSNGRGRGGLYYQLTRILSNLHIGTLFPFYGLEKVWYEDLLIITMNSEATGSLVSLHNPEMQNAHIFGNL